MSLRARLEGKKRRRVVVPVEVSPQTEDQAARVATLTAERLAAIAKGDNARADELEAQVDAVMAENRVEVAFTAVAPDVFEKVVATYADDDGGMDRDKALPMLAALCAEDEELQDDEWWSEQIKSGAWGYGELTHLWQALLAINSNTPPAYVPKD